MPYIPQKDRQLYENDINQLVDKLVKVFSDEPTKISTQRAGHLNYILTTTLLRFYRKLTKKLGISIRYSDYNEIIGMLESAKLEMYRRQVATYEDQKIKSEGDVE